VDLVAEQLACIPELEYGFDAIGFSQGIHHQRLHSLLTHDVKTGGQFLRAYVQFYNDPPVRNLITYGSQHMGISDLPGCSVSDPIWCSIARSAARLGVYTTWAQSNLVQAQYFRDVDNIDKYLNTNSFLTRLNDEVGEAWDGGKNKSAKMKDRLTSLENMVLVLFEQDQTVVPKESAWFGSFALPEQDLKRISSTTQSWHSFAKDCMRMAWPKWPFPKKPGHVSDRTIVPMELQPLYTEDRIGIRTLDESGRLHFFSCDAQHMQIKLECWLPLVQEFVGGSLSEEELLSPMNAVLIQS
jgi:palmitoyl-protein thioesterase